MKKTKNKNLRRGLSFLLLIALVAGLVMTPLYPILNKRIPRRYLYIGGMISMIVAYVLLVFMFKVKISEKMHDEIVKELEAKLASGEIEDEGADAPAEVAGSGVAGSAAGSASGSGSAA